MMDMDIMTCCKSSFGGPSSLVNGAKKLDADYEHLRMSHQKKKHAQGLGSSQGDCTAFPIHPLLCLPNMSAILREGAAGIITRQSIAFPFACHVA